MNLPAIVSKNGLGRSILSLICTFLCSSSFAQEEDFWAGETNEQFEQRSESEALEREAEELLRRQRVEEQIRRDEEESREAEAEVRRHRALADAEQRRAENNGYVQDADIGRAILTGAAQGLEKEMSRLAAEQQAEAQRQDAERRANSRGRQSTAAESTSTTQNGPSSGGNTLERAASETTDLPEFQLTDFCPSNAVQGRLRKEMMDKLARLQEDHRNASSQREKYIIMGKMNDAHGYYDEAMKIERAKCSDGRSDGPTQVIRE